MFFIFKRNKEIYEKIEKFLTLTIDVFQSFEKGIKHYVKSGIDSKFDFFMDTTNKIESNADDVLDSITIKLYKKSLLPESREDILILLNNVDDIIDRANLILRDIYTRGLTLPDFLHADTREMLKVSVKAHELIVQSVKDLFQKRDAIIENTRTIDNYESICDSLQFNMNKALFSSDIDNYKKLLLKDFINNMASLTDLCEDASHVITVINIKKAV